MGDLSPHFSTAEFECRGRRERGHQAHPVVVSRSLVAALERLRSLNNDRPLVILSGHRCSFWNVRVGGATASQHLLGTAADLRSGYTSEARCRAAGFTGVGLQGPWAVHVDVRPRPATWRY